MKPYSVSVYFTDGSDARIGCDDLDLDAQEGTLTLLGTYANGCTGRRVIMLRRIKYYDIRENPQ